MKYTDEIHLLYGVPYISFKDGFKKWFLPTLILRPGANIDDMFKLKSPDVATVFFDDLDHWSGIIPR